MVAQVKGPAEAAVVAEWSAIGRVMKRRGRARIRYVVEPYAGVSLPGFPKGFGNLESLRADWVRNRDAYLAAAPVRTNPASVAPVATGEGEDSGRSPLGLLEATESATAKDGAWQPLAVGDSVTLIGEEWRQGVVAGIDGAVVVDWEDEGRSRHRGVELFKPAAMNGGAL